MKKKPNYRNWALGYKSLAIPYFRMAKCHTIIGSKRFHFRVRDGIGWFTLAMFTKQTGVAEFLSAKNGKSVISRCIVKLANITPIEKLIGCYMVKPHGQLVHVSYIHY